MEKEYASKFYKGGANNIYNEETSKFFHGVKWLNPIVNMEPRPEDAPSPLEIMHAFALPDGTEIQIKYGSLEKTKVKIRGEEGQIYKAHDILEKVFGTHLE